MAYPTSLDDLTTASTNSTIAKDAHPALHNDANTAINAIEETLGVNPQGDEDTVAARIAAIASLLAASGVGVALYDSGTETWEARPSGFACVFFISGVHGVAKPSDKEDLDPLIEPAE